MRNQKRHNGFTLIELLLVTILIPIVSFAVFALFNSGFQLWRGLIREVPEEDEILLSRRLAADFDNLLRYTGLPFQGDGQSVTFCTVIEAKPDLGGNRAIGHVEYFYDDTKKALVRQERNLREIHKEEPGRMSVLFGNVSGFSIGYFVKDPVEDAYIWKDEWPGKSEKLPLAVRFGIEYSQAGERRSLERTVVVPIGG